MKLEAIVIMVVAAGACADGSDSEQNAIIQELADAHCAARAVCNCAEGSAPCGESERERITNAFAEAGDRGLASDPDCMRSRLADYEIFGCKSLYEFTLDELTDYWNGNTCASFYGDAAIGDSCTRLEQGFGSECGRGLYCEDDRCEAWPRKPSLGEACTTALRGCAGDAVCVTESDTMSLACVALPGADEPCAGLESVCAPGLACAGDLCASAPSVGAACAASEVSYDQCSADAVCLDGVCEQRAGLGEPCQLATCAAGLYCDSDAGTCAAGEPAICGDVVP